jgi:hypothetical protein
MLQRRVRLGGSAKARWRNASPIYFRKIIGQPMRHCLHLLFFAVSALLWQSQHNFANAPSAGRAGRAENEPLLQ